MKALLLAVLFAFSAQAYATGEGTTDDEDTQTQDQDQTQDQTQSQDQWQGQDQNQGQEQNAAGGSVNLSQSYDSRRVPPIFLYQANQVEACGRVFGFSGANTSGGWAFGIPIPRSWTPTCDLWKAANEAQENGFIWLSYTFQCSIRTVRKTLGDERCMAVENAAENEMRLAMGMEPLAHLPIPDMGLYNQAAQYAAEDDTVGVIPTHVHDPSEYYMLDQEGRLVAQVAEEEFEAAVTAGQEQHEMTEERIKELEEENARIQREADELRRRQEAEARERSSKQSQLYSILERIEQREEVAAQEEEDPK